MPSKIFRSLYRIGLDDDGEVTEILLVAMIKSGVYGEALTCIKNALSKYRLDHGILNHLLSLAECGDIRVAEEARRLYDRHMYLYDEYLDMNDVIVTGLTFDHFRKRDRKRLAEISMSGFAAMINADDKLTDHMLYLMTLERAADIYEKKKTEMMALHCRMRLCACGYRPKDSVGAAARLRNKVGNKKLSRQLAEKAAGMKESAVGSPVTTPPFASISSDVWRAKLN
jgi:hypothetical protein